MVSPTSHPPAATTTGPAWDIARLFPDQGAWTEQDYLRVTEDLNRLVELAHGRIEVLEMPKQHHQLIVDFLVALLNAFVRPRKLGRVVSAPFKVRLEAGLFREPDVSFMRREHFGRTNDDFWEGADLAIEVVSPDPQSRERDYVTKRGEYARAGIAEYWIVDPGERRVIVLKLVDGSYVTHGDWTNEGTATSATLTGFGVSLAEMWEAAAAE